MKLVFQFEILICIFKFTNRVDGVLFIISDKIYWIENLTESSTSVCVCGRMELLFEKLDFIQGFIHGFIVWIFFNDNNLVYYLFSIYYVIFQDVC